MFSFTSTKFGTSIKRNGEKVIFCATNCTCTKAIHETKQNSWYITITVPDDIKNMLFDLDSQARNFVKTQNFRSSLIRDEMYIKIPFRYKKFECSFFESSGNRIVSSDIKENDSIELLIECTNMWSIDGMHGLNWSTKQIIKKI
jgi:hypothetical protein